MPSAYTTRPHLSWILGLEPPREPRCVGYDISRGRRCNTEVTPRDRDIAQTFLDMTATQFHAGRPVDYLLELIAPRVLCRGNHQRLAPLLVARWEREIAAVEALDNTPRPLSEGYTYDTGYGYEYSYEHDNHAEPGVGSRRGRIYQGIQDKVQGLRERIRDIHFRRLWPDLSSFTIFCRGRGSIVDEDNDAHDQSYWNFYYDSTFDYYYRPYIDPTYTFEPLYAGSSHTEPRPPAPASTCEAHRRPVEGDCSICLCSLLEPAPTDPSSTSWQWNATDSGSSSDPYNDWYRGMGWWNYIPGGGHVNEDEVEEREGRFGSVSWCRAKCGVNFHTSCIDSWLYMAGRATCPVCRSPWVFG
ncbi:uncharacterized protein APUU_11141S [Aspergillus puulaauensis]|uniref:RING-type domain-containing protein n=1 Tax=Aspergillus puulaauensis TaxID=1220207 RepID=A0A7R7XBR6_9EURO|nr:uncharacterized protein APUU_11141S [Aspergillus puulaauensis]BCS18313.1 hypothetical protein APUU_11141S [Aspergillus puulaauensis]